MKKALMLAGLLFVAGLAKSQVKVAELSFVKESISLGKIKQGIPANTQFTFKNTGSIPLILNEVQPTCGCTAADYSKTPILPGKTGFIKITYNAATTGPFHKTITVLSNSKELSKVITITGEVMSEK
jgi:hypothetical protein